MGLTTYSHDLILNAWGQHGSYGGPATHYVGLLGATTWLTGHAYSLGAYVIPTTFGSITGQTGKIFKCTTAGTSAGSQPTWPTTAGGTVTDGGTLVWTEVSLLFQAGTFTGAEVTGTSYARVAVTGNSTNFPNASSAQPAVIQNGTAITFPSPGSDWGLAVGWFTSDAASDGNVSAWGALSSAPDCPSGSTPSFAASAFQLQLTP
jgi:hypothetical protein